MALSVDRKLINSAVLPGDVIATAVNTGSAGKQEGSGPVRLGPGLQVVEGGTVVLCVRAGVLRYVSKLNKYFVESYQKKYIPMLEDMVIGVVRARGEYYRVDIGAHQYAQLHNLSFDGATKRNKPNLRVGDLVYCRVIQADRHLEANEVTCQSAKNKKDWVTSESIFGQLKGGYVFECSLAMCRKLLDPQCTVLSLLGSLFRFEIAVGMNGRVWISCEQQQQQQQQQQHEDDSSIPLDAHETTVLIVNVIQSSEHLLDDDKALAKFVSSAVREYITKRTKMS